MPFSGTMVVHGSGVAVVAFAAVEAARALGWGEEEVRTQAVLTLVPPAGLLLALVPVPPPGWAMATGAALLTPFLIDLVRTIPWVKRLSG